MLTALVEVVATVSVLANAVVYGTDVFAAIVMRSMYARLDDATVIRVAGWGHFYADRRMPIAGATGAVTAVLTTVLAAVDGRVGAAIAGGIAVAVLLGWLSLYVTVAKPINTRQTAAARSGVTPDDARALQTKWDSVINIRALLQAAALIALCAALALG